MPVKVAMSEASFSPSSPSQSAPISFSVKVATEQGFSAPDSITSVKLVYQLTESRAVSPSESGWQELPLSLHDGAYTGSLPALNQVGHLWYYFECDFEGYYFSEGIDKLSPAFLTADGMTYQWAPKYEGFYHFDVNEFSSDYESVAFDGVASSTATLVGDNLWEVTARVKGLDSVTGRFLGFLDGDTTYWGDQAQSTISAPFGSALALNASAITVTNDNEYTHLVFSVDTTSLTYEVVGTNMPVVITFANDSIAASDQTNGERSDVKVNLSTSDGTLPEVCVVFRNRKADGNDTAWTTNTLDVVRFEDSAKDFSASGLLPALLDNAIQYYFVASDEAIIPGKSPVIATSATNSIVVAKLPGSDRYTGFDGWVAEGDPLVVSNWYMHCENGDRWIGTGVCVDTLAANRITTSIPVPVGFLYNYSLDTEVSFTSPILDGGLGTIFYESRMKDGGDGEMKIQVARVDNPTDFDWETVKTISYKLKSQSTIHNEPVRVNDYDVRRVRFIRSGVCSISTQRADGGILLDNIVLSRPPTDVRMAKFLNEPGYPSQYENFKMRCRVDDESENTPAVNRKITLWYQHTFSEDDRPVLTASRWKTIPMTDTGDNHYFECYVPTQEVGYIWYFYEADFDGYRYDSREDKGKVYLNDGVNGYGNPANGKSITPLNPETDRLQIRPFKSSDGKVFQLVNCTPTDEYFDPFVITNEMKLVGHEQWQSLLDVSKYSHCESYFYAYDHYNTGADNFEQRPRIWGEENQGEEDCTAPLANNLEKQVGKASPDETLNPLVVKELEKDTGSLLFRFDTVEGEGEGYYIVKRAVYQDFDEWQASEDNYEESLGGAETVTEETSFDDWSRNFFQRDVTGEGAFTPFYSADVSSEFYEPRSITCTSPAFVRSASRVIAERKQRETDGVNYALALEKTYGSLINSKNGFTRGVDKLTFRARSTIDDDYFAIYKNGTAWTLPLHISSQWELQRGPSKCYLSYILLYKVDPWALAATWFEYRIIQSDGTDGDTGLRVELWRHNADGTEVMAQGLDIPANTGKNLGNSNTISLEVTNSNGIQVRVDFNGKSNYGNAVSDKSSAAQSMVSGGGTIGFGVFDAVPSITASTIKVGTSSDSNGPKNDLLGASGNVVSDASFRTSWHDGGNGRWTCSSGIISRAVPQQTIDINYADMNEDYDSSKLVKKESVTVKSLEYKSYTVDFKVWNQQYIEILYADGEGGVVVDDPEISAWRGWTRAKDTTGGFSEESYYWTTLAEQNEWVGKQNSWAVLQGAIDATAGFSGNSVYLETSRACPDTADEDGEVVELPIQGVVSPKMQNGLGSVKFNVQALAGRCVYAVEVTQPNLDSQWQTKAVFTNDAAQSTESIRRYISIRQEKSGNHIARARIRIIPSESSADAKLLIDNLTVKDYPPRDAATWLAFNARVTANSDNPPVSSVSDPTRIFNASGKSCFLNNGLDDAHGCAGEDFSASEPYIQSPMVETGVGEISFQYRSFDGNPAELIIMAAPAEDTPLEDWTVLTNMTITGTSYVTFQNEKIYDVADKVVRFYSSTNSAGRVCIDNILITEPVRASFEIQLVRLLPEQPVVGSNSVIEVEIGRFLMKPQNVKIYVSVHEGDETWGFNNWWTRTNTSRSRRYELTKYGDDPNSRVYRSEAILPAKSVDDVVQYVVWGTHSEIGASDPVIFMTKEAYSFEKPSYDKSEGDTVNYPPWYYPMDLNTILGDDANWSPYYYVYSSPLGSVWFNEISYYRGSVPTVGQYVELLGKSGVDIGNWTIELLEAYGDVDEWEEFGFGNHTFAAGTKLVSIGEGWGIYMLCDSVSGKNANIPTGASDVLSEYTASKRLIPINTSCGVFILKRSNGSYERTLVVGSASASKDAVAAGYEWAGQRQSGNRYSLSLASKSDETQEDGLLRGKTYEDFEWPGSTPDNTAPTPGQLNGNQAVANIGGDDPVVSKYVFISVLHGLYGTQAYGEGAPSTAVITEEVEAGESVVVSYAANDWYRIEKLESNSAAVSGAAGEKSYVFEIASMSADVSNEVFFAELPAADRYNCPIEWLSNWTEAAIAAGDQDALSVYDEYLMGTDPTADSVVDLSFQGIQVGEEGTRLWVELLRNENKQPISGKINGVIGIYGFSDLADIGDLTKATFHGTLTETFAGETLADQTFEAGTARFFKAVAEEAPTAK